MENSFKCGYVKAFDADATPNWDEFSVRMGFAQDKLGLNAVFMEAFEDEAGNWLVPFFCAEDHIGRFAKAEHAISKGTPYSVHGIRSISLATADLETLRAISALVPEPAPAVKAADVAPNAAKARVEKPEDIFDGLVGMDKQKLMLMRLSNVIHKHGRDAIDCFHFAFVGKPGTGKSELANRLVYYLDHLKITDGTRKIHKVGEADLVAKYVGHTAPKVKQAVEGALGGVLFIDEFYAIANAPRFGREAIDALTDQIEKHRYEFVCVIAGYPREVDETLNYNPGLRSRFGFRIEFPDYSNEELDEIFVGMAGKRGFEVVDRDVLSECTSRLRSTRDFANARSMRQLVDHSVVEAAWSHDDPTIRGHDLMVATDELFETKQRVGF